MERAGKYVRSILMPGEEILWVGKVSKFIYVRATLLIAFGGVAIAEAADPEGSVTRSLLPGADPTAIQVIASLIGAALVFLSVLYWLRAFMRRWTTELAITDRRVISKLGFVGRQTWELNTGGIEGVQVKQSILGRIFNFGDLTVTGRGAGTAPIRWIDDPIEFRRRLPSM